MDPTIQNLTRSQHTLEVRAGNRFEFGKNWSSFLETLDDTRIEQATMSLQKMLGVDRLDQMNFVDVGCGSGLFSLAAKRLGANVYSFDYDPNSVACARELKRRYFANTDTWVIEEGSALDREFLQSCGEFDIVYSWGVLHHTGKMWQALENVTTLLKPESTLFISIYNNQGAKSRIWLTVKRIYNKLPQPLKLLFALSIVVPVELAYWARQAMLGSPLNGVRRWTQYKYKSSRGMSAWHDWIDWIGGYPFEVAKPEEIFDFYHGRGLRLIKLKTCAGGLGCNEFVFKKVAR